jgi:hypothetical protein
VRTRLPDRVLVQGARRVLRVQHAAQGGDGSASHRSRLAGNGSSRCRSGCAIFFKRDAELQGAALHLFLREVEQCLRAHSPGSSPAARLGAVAFIHRFGSTLNPQSAPGATVASRRPLTLSASQRSGQVKTCYAARDDAPCRWISYPSAATKTRDSNMRENWMVLTCSARALSKTTSRRCGRVTVSPIGHQ